MASSSFSIEVNPAVLHWARITAGKEIPEVAKSVDIAEQTLIEWEAGRKPPSWKTLRQLARCYQRPVAALLLPEPPSTTDALPDFRNRTTSKRTLSASTLLAIRTAKWLQSRAIEMRRELGVDTAFVSGGITASTDHEALAARERIRLGIDLAKQFGWPDAYAAFRDWKAALAELGILVFQFRFPRDEVQGFSLFDETCPAIVVNEEDAVQARIFTLFHEYAHLLLQESGICTPREVKPQSTTNVEPFCNRFASSLLVPSTEVNEWSISLGDSPASDDKAIQGLAQRYRVSKDVILIKLRTTSRISETTFNRIYSRWRKSKSTESAKTSKPPTRKGFGPSAVQKCVRQRGKVFIELVVETLNRGHITDRDALSYLDIKIKDLNKIEGK